MTVNNPSITGVDVNRANACLKELQKESDRGAALVGNDYLDHLMKKFLKARMNQGKTGATTQDRPKRISEKLLKYPGPLSTAASRVDLAHVLGWIGPKMYADLGTIRKIRNKFAHFHAALDFNDKKIGDLCSGLHSLRFVGPYRLARNRDKFLAGVCFLMIQITGLTQDQERPGLGPDPHVDRLDPSTFENQS